MPISSVLFENLATKAFDIERFARTTVDVNTFKLYE